MERAPWGAALLLVFVLALTPTAIMPAFGDDDAYTGDPAESAELFDEAEALDSLD